MPALFLIARVWEVQRDHLVSMLFPDPRADALQRALGRAQVTRGESLMKGVQR